MSRVGNSPIKIPVAVTVNIDGSNVSTSGPLGRLNLTVPANLKVENIAGAVLVKRSKEDKMTKSLHGLIRSLINNMILGVEKGWEKKLELVGVGYRAQTNGQNLTLNVGYSHPVVISAPDGVKFTILENTKITVSGFDKHLVGQIAAQIRAVKPPEPYQGKGIRYLGERVRRKAGKAGKVGVGGAK